VYELATGTIKDASVSSSGVPGNLWSNGGKSLSADGRYAAFGSKASNLVNGDTNDSWDVFVHDFVTAETTRVSVNSSGAQRVDDSTNPSISGDGRYVAFETWAHFDPNDTLYWDIYVHDRQTGETTLVSVDSSGNYGNFHSTNAAISADGRYVAFESLASNLVPGDTNGVSDVFVHDRVTATTTRVSVDTSGNQLGRPSHNPSISQDGRYIAWNTLNISNVYVRDQVTGQVVIASVSDSGDVRGGINPHLTPDAKFIAFESVAKLVPEDTNTYDDIYLRGRELTLEAEPVVVSPGSTLTLSTYHGTSGNAASLWAVQLDSNPLFRLIAVGSFASDGGWVLSGTVPSGWATGDLTFRGYCIGLHGFVTTTNDVTVTFQ
jgi:Tol biopolymer transport system component